MDSDDAGDEDLFYVQFSSDPKSALVITLLKCSFYHPCLSPANQPLNFTTMSFAESVLVGLFQWVVFLLGSCYSGYPYLNYFDLTILASFVRYLSHGSVENSKLIFFSAEILDKENLYKHRMHVGDYEFHRTVILSIIVSYNCQKSFLHCNNSH